MATTAASTKIETDSTEADNPTMHMGSSGRSTSDKSNHIAIAPSLRTSRLLQRVQRHDESVTYDDRILNNAMRLRHTGPRN